MNSYVNAKDLLLYTGSKFSGCLALWDIRHSPYLICEGDKINFFISNEETTKQITLTCNDETEGKYPFILSSEETAEMSGDYDYYAFLNFADGDTVQIVPKTLLRARIPCGIIDQDQKKHRIEAIVPRDMVSGGNYYMDSSGDVHNDIPLGTDPLDAYARTNLDLKNKAGELNDKIEQTAESLNVRISSEIAAVNSRTDNIIAHNNDTEGNTELIDIRTAHDGTVFESAGTSVRAQVSSLKNRLVIDSKNLFDPSTITENVYPLSTGVLTDDSTETLFTSDYIHVTPSTNYYESSAYISGTHFICTYDSEKSFIERIIVNNNEWTPLENNTVKGRAYTSGSTVHYIRICTTKTLLSTLQLEAGTAYTGYQPHDELTMNNDLIIPQLEPLDERISALENCSFYTLPFIKGGKCMPPAVTTNTTANKTVGYVFADMGEDCRQIKCNWIFENRQGHSAQLTVYTNPVGCDSIDHITGQGLHLQIYPEYFKLDVLGANYTDGSDEPLYYYNELSGGKVYFNTPLACDGETVHTLSLYSNVQGTKIHCIINGTDYSFDYTDQYGYIPSLREAIGRYVGFEMYGNGRSEDAFPIVTMFRADGYAADGVSPKNNVLLDYFNRQDGQLSVAPTGQVYKLMNNNEYKR